ncbi:YfhO family protein [Armatimonas sp.]|uniref:YfhO family protein n=1 Tax=Armatimonas sp. TaxID=1872638 RepID=UPI00286C15B1|nr:YfhO family protein [Armatimonas sp.]
MTGSESLVRLGEDGPLSYYPWRAFAQECLRAGVLPHWKPYSFAGMPFLASLEPGFFSPWFWLTLALPAGLGLLWGMLANLCLGAVGMYFLLLHYTRSVPAAMFAGLAFVLGTFFTARVGFGHFPVIEAVVGMPWLLLVTEKALVEPRSLRWPVLLGALYGVNLLAGFPEISFMVSVVFTLRWLLGLRVAPVALTLRYGIVVLISLGLSAIQLFPALTVLERTSRIALPLSFVREQSVPPLALPMLVIPDLLGSAAAHNALLKGPSAEMPGYVGVLTLQFALVALLLARQQRTWLFGALALGGILLAMGTFNPLYPFLSKLPILNLIARPMRWMFLVAFSLPTLGGLGLAALLDAEKNDLAKLRPYFVGILLLGFVVLVIAVVGQRWLMDWGQAQVYARYPEHPERQLAKLQGMLAGQRLGLALFVVWSGLALVFLFLRSPRRGYLPLVVLFLDLWLSNAKYLSLPRPISPLPIEAFHAILPVDATDYRFLPLGETKVWPEAGIFSHRNSAVGYDSLTSQEFVRFLAVAFGKAPTDIDPLSPTTKSKDWPLTKTGLLDRLGVRYVISESPIPFTQLSPQLYRRDTALPLASIATTWVVEASSTKALELLKTLPTGPVIISQPLEQNVTTHLAMLTTKRPDPNTIEIKTNAASGLLVIHEAYYKGWLATIDGKPVPILGADYLFMGVLVPPRAQDVSLTYHTPNFREGSYVTGITGAGLLIFLVVSVAKRRKFR